MTISIIRILPALAVTAFAAAACSSGEAAERWSVSNSQIGPVTARTAFDRDTLAGLLPGFDVAEATGLGLTIVRTFVEGELGGRISLSPVPGGRGTVAEVRVPASCLVSPWGDSRDPTG